MGKLTKQQSKYHAQAMELLKKTQRNEADDLFIFKHYHEGSVLDQTAAGAFFTPHRMASDFRFDVYGHRILDLCAGIGVLSYYTYWHDRYNEPRRDITCIERCPEFVEVGKRLLPEANWICADITEINLAELGDFDSVIANPPFGVIPGNKLSAPRYSGSKFEYQLMDIASDIADYGLFIVPQTSAGFAFSGMQYYQRTKSREYLKFEEQTGIRLDAGMGVDTSFFDDDWKQNPIRTEIVCADFIEAREARKPAQASLFEGVF